MKELLLYVIFACLAYTTRGLRNVHVSVPDATLSGDSATLHCYFDLDGDALYSIKWYKGRQEFYRFTPRETPPVKAFPIPGLAQLQVDVAKSNETQVVLRQVGPSMSGRYSCEVSADAPSFQTALVTGQMDVVTPPKQRPSLQGLRSRYKPGDLLRANCTSADSSPAANLSWQLNGHHVDKHFVKAYNEVHEDGEMETSSSILEKILTHKDFNNNSRLKIRCTASILSVYWQTTEKSLEWDRPKEQPTGYQTKQNVLLNFKTDVESALVDKDGPTRMTKPTTSSSTSVHVLSSTLCWRTLLIILGFLLL